MRSESAKLGFYVRISAVITPKWDSSKLLVRSYKSLILRNVTMAVNACGPKSLQTYVSRYPQTIPDISSPLKSPKSPTQTRPALIANTASASFCGKTVIGVKSIKSNVATPSVCGKTLLKIGTLVKLSSVEISRNNTFTVYLTLFRESLVRSHPNGRLTALPKHRKYGTS